MGLQGSSEVLEDALGLVAPPRTPCGVLLGAGHEVARVLGVRDLRKHRALIVWEEARTDRFCEPSSSCWLLSKHAVAHACWCRALSAGKGPNASC